MTDWKSRCAHIEWRYRELEAINAELVEALAPFARWAEGVEDVDQPDSLQFRTLSPEGNVRHDEITPRDLRCASTAIAKARGAP